MIELHNVIKTIHWLILQHHLHTCYHKNDIHHPPPYTTSMNTLLWSEAAVTTSPTRPDWSCLGVTGPLAHHSPLITNHLNSPLLPVTPSQSSSHLSAFLCPHLPSFSPPLPSPTLRTFTAASDPSSLKSSNFITYSNQRANDASNWTKASHSFIQHSTNFSHDKALFKVSVDPSGCLRCLGTILFIEKRDAWWGEKIATFDYICNKVRS